MKLRFVIRDILHSRNQGLVFVLCVALSLVSVVSVNSFRRDVRQSITSDARGLHGGDIIVHSHYPFSPGLNQELQVLTESERAEVVRSWAFYSVARTVDDTGTLFANIKAVDDGYPLYGVVDLQSGRSFAEVLQPGTAVVAAAVLQRLGLVVGDRILLGSGDFVIGDVIMRESMRPVDLFTLGPRILVSAADLGEMDLVKKGSRVQYDVMLRLTDQQELQPLVERLQQVAVEGQERVETYETAGSRVKRFFDNLLFFLSLISVFTMLLAGIGMQSALAALFRSKEKSGAVMRALGASRNHLLQHYMAIVCILSGLGCLLGIIGGIALVNIFPYLFKGLLPDTVRLGLSGWDMLEGLVVGGAVVIFFTALPLAGIREIKPRSVFSHDSAGRPKAKETLVFLICGLLLLGGLVIRQLEDVTVGLALMGGVLVVIAVVVVLVAAMMRLLVRINGMSLALRQALRSLVRPGNASRSIVATLASACGVLLLIYLLQNNLRATYIDSYPENAPNLFCLDIQKAQQQGFRDLVGDEVELYPIIRARLQSIDGERIDRQKEQRKRGDSLTREFNLTYRQDLLEDEVLLEGETLFGSHLKKEAIPVSILDTVAEMGDMHVGDVLSFNIQGVPLTAVVTSIRGRTKSMLYPFFYFVFPPQYLEAAPQTFFAALRVDTSKIALLENTIVSRYPNISTINVAETAAELGRVTNRLSTIVTFFASFSIAAGALILISSILATRLERIKEVVYYRVLGAKTGFVIKVFLYENIVLALFSGCFALVLGQLAAWSICHFLFEVAHKPAIGGSLLFLLVIIVAVVLLGLAGSITIIRRKPGQFLREMLG